MRAARHTRGVASRILVVATIAAVLGIGGATAGADTLPVEILPLETPSIETPPTTAAGTPLDPTSTASAQATGVGQPLVGTFELTAAACSGSVSGSYFRMIQPGGDGGGPYVENGDSPCTDNTYTPMAPGTDGGLVTGSYQAPPDPAFNATGGGLAGRITKPQKFFGVDFASSTSPTDPQTGTAVAAPALTHDGAGSLTGDLRAFGASWNNQHFNQGAPKPDGSTPGSTSIPTGTYDATTGAFTLEWTSQIVGGPFNGFTGLWYFEGTFSSSQATPAAGPDTSGNGDETAAPTGAVSSGGVSAPAGGGTAGSPLANTGPTSSATPGLVLLLAGVAGLTALNRVRRPSATGTITR